MERAREVNEEGFHTVISSWLCFLFGGFNYLLEFGHWQEAGVEGQVKFDRCFWRI